MTPKNRIFIFRMWLMNFLNLVIMYQYIQYLSS